MFKVPEKFRIKSGFMGSSETDGNNGMFTVKGLKFKRPLTCQASDGLGWEHVSVSLPDRCPTWEEMNAIKNLFWDKSDLVVQMHPVEQDYINLHPYCLHLWRRVGTNEFCETPPPALVGINARGA